VRFEGTAYNVWHKLVFDDVEVGWLTKLDGYALGLGESFEEFVEGFDLKEVS
jgi:hypothetical protein